MNAAPTIPALVTRAAARLPDHPALALAGEQLTYSALEQGSNRVANMLIDHGVSPGDRVGLFAHKSMELLVAMHGVMKAGAAYVPINPDGPPAYLAEILGACEIRHLFAGRTTRSAVVAALNEAELDLIVGIDAPDIPTTAMAWSEVGGYAATAPEVDVAAEDLAYIMFTSGSTGRPKGIMHTHRSGLAYGEVAAATYGFRHPDRIANHAPLNFDLCLLELWGGLAAGATVVIIPEAHGRLPASFSQMLQDERVTIVNAVPYALVQLLHRGALDERDLSALRWVVFGGEVFPTKDLRSLMRHLPQAAFANVYGPAEVNGVTYHIVPEIPAGTNEPIPIGRLYPGMEALIVDATDEETPLGETGELLIKSPTHMVGYWRQPDLTAACTHYRPGPSGTDERWHRTGDLVYQDQSGLLRLVGRKDRMVKSRGHRVELDEIEAALVSHTAVDQAVVYIVPDGEGSQQIQAAVILREAGPDEAELKQYLAASLPRYAVPRVLEVVASVPRTSSGKPDRVALAAQASSHSSPAPSRQHESEK